MFKFKLVKTDDYNRLKSENEVNKLRIEELKMQIEKLENPESHSTGYWCEACVYGHSFRGMLGTNYGCLKNASCKCEDFEKKKGYNV